MAVQDGERDDGHGAIAAGGSSSRRTGSGALRRVLAVCLGGWVALAAYLFFTPDAAELTEVVRPSLGHAVVFAAIGATAAALSALTGLGSPRAVVAAGVAGGIAVEVVQELTPFGRGFQVVDIVADAVGLLVGVGTVAIAGRTVRRPGLVASATAVGSALLLVAVAVVAAVGPLRLQTWWDCRGVDQPPAGEPLVRIDPGSASVAGDDGATRQLEARLAPLRTPDGYRFDGDDTVRLDDARSITCALRGADGFTVLADVVDVAPGQEGPARIISLSRSTSPEDIDLHLGVEGDGISVRAREHASKLHQVIVPEVRHRGPLRLLLTYDGAAVRLVADGRTVLELEDSLDLTSWDLDRPLLIGNEATGDRGLVGTITLLELYAGFEPGAGG